MEKRLLAHVAVKSLLLGFSFLHYSLYSHAVDYFLRVLEPVVSATCTWATCCLSDVSISSHASVHLSARRTVTFVQIESSPHSSTLYSCVRRTRSCFDSSFFFSWLFPFFIQKMCTVGTPGARTHSCSSLTCHDAVSALS